MSRRLHRAGRPAIGYSNHLSQDDGGHQLAPRRPHPQVVAPVTAAAPQRQPPPPPPPTAGIMVPATDRDSGCR